jgi:hypothetical protein
MGAARLSRPDLDFALRRAVEQERTIDLVDADLPAQRRSNRRFQITPAQTANNEVLEHIYQIRQMRPLSIWWIILTLAALAVLLGPIDYLVLKRLDRLPYTWVTSAGWIGLFTVGAYYGVQWVRGGEMEVRAVSVLDGVADSNVAWATTYMGVFAPRSADYRLGGLGPGQWWSGLAPSQREIWSHQREAGMRQIHCVQRDGVNLPLSLPINIWTVQSLVGEWPLESLPFEATVGRSQETAIVDVVNTSETAIQRGYVLFEDAWAMLGAVPARGTRRFEVRIWPYSDDATGPVRRGGPRPSVQGPASPHGFQGGPVTTAVFAQGCLPRTLAMEEHMGAGAALVWVAFENAPLPFEVEDRTYLVDHTQLARLVVPSGTLANGNR